MSSSNQQAPRSTVAGPSRSPSRLAQSLEDVREVDLKEWLADLWGGRYFILACVMGMLLLGLLFIWRSTPIYQVEALLQIEPPKAVRESDAAYTRMENLFSAPSEVSTEIEIIGSNLVLGRSVEALNLDIVARPVLFPILGEALARGKADAPRLEVDTFVLPDTMRGLEFQIEALPEGAFAWKSPGEVPASAGKPGAALPVGAELARGKVGELLECTYGGEPLKLKIRRLVAKPGQAFRLLRKPMLSVIKDLRIDLEAAEKGATQPNKSTNLLALTFRHTSPVKGAEILNEIMRQYVRQNAERKNEEVGHALGLLQQQLPEVHDRLTLAENRLNQFRARTGAVDIPKEAELTLQQSSNLGSQITALRQKKEDLLRIYQEGSDVVSTVNGQISKLEAEAAAVSQKVRGLPGTQQELVRLSREVQVSTELYTALLNNIQQLQITGASTTHNRVVDYALPSQKPIKPKKEMLLAVFFALGLFLGVAVVLGRRALQHGVEDHRLLESKLDLPVLVTIPHSKAQEVHYQDMSKVQSGMHILAHHDPEDLATESLRSLRTTLSFSASQGEHRTLMVTGPAPMVGKSFVSSNLAVVLAQAGAKVLVVDGDMRRGNLHKYFGLPNRLGGLSEVIAGEAALLPSIQDTEVPGLNILSSGRIPKNPAELLMSDGFSAFIEAARKEYDTILIDAPPLLPVTDAVIIGSKVDSVLLVAKFGQHPLDEFRACQDRLESSGIPLTGCVFNDIQPTGLGYHGQQYRYAYHYKYGQT